MKKIKDFISVLLAALIVFALPISAMAASSDIDNGSNYDFFTVWIRGSLCNLLRKFDGDIEMGRIWLIQT